VRRGRDARFTLIGDGEDKQRLELMAKSMGLSSVLRMTGALEQGEVLALMQRATVLCLPCLIGEDGNRDALPTVLLEALAAGLPIVSTPVTGIPEIVDHGRVGLLVAERDPMATADAIERLLQDKALRTRLARDGRAHAEEHFDSRCAARTLHEWFDETLSGVPR
jgi:glycosyltransferase involved in cell wall biosynthesis